MATQFTDFSSKPLIDSPWKNLFEDVLKGYKMAKEPAKMREEQTARELANKEKGLEVEHKPKEYELNDKQKEFTNALQEKAVKHYEEKLNLEKQYKESQIAKNNRPSASAANSIDKAVTTFKSVHPDATPEQIAVFADRLLESQIQKNLKTNSGSGQKANKGYANWLVAHPEATQEEKLDAYNKIANLEQEHEQTIINRSKDVVAGKAYDTLPPDEKRRAIGVMVGMGVDPLDADKLLRQGISPTEYAKKNGIDINAVDPVYPLDKENVKQLQRRRGYVAELKNLEDKVVAGMGKYQNKLFGYSLEQMVDMLKGENPDEQGKVLAARALQPEIAALRLKVAGANIGIHAINELKDKSLGNLKIIEGLVDTPTYIAMQKYMTQYLNEASNEYENALNNYNRLGKHQWLKTNEQKSAEAESGKANDPLGLR